MNVKQKESAEAWLLSWKNKPILLLSGPTASGKTTLAFDLLSKRNARELSGFDAKMGEELHLISEGAGAKTVLEYAGSLSEGRTKPDTLVIEDLDFCNATNARAVVQFAKARVMPVVCTVSTQKQLDTALLDLALRLRLYRPTPKVAAALLAARAPEKDPKLVLRIVERSNCDMRQALNELALISTTGHDLSPDDTGVDKEAPGVYDAMPMLYPNKGLDVSLKLADQGDPVLGMMVAENYHKERGLGLDKMARVADDISGADVLARHEAGPILGIASATFGSKALSARCVYPSVVSRLATEAANKRRLSHLPGRVDYTTIGPIEKRIVRTLERGAPARMVAMEMRSMGLTRLDQWETIRSLSCSTMGTAAKIPTSKRDALMEALSVIDR